MKVDFNLIWDWGMELLPAKLNTQDAKAMICAIGLQESRFEYRRQMNEGPAMGWWQFERGGGVFGVLNNDYTEKIIKPICSRLGVEPTSEECWQALQYNDVLALCFARLLLYTGPWKLPGPTDVREGWRQYLWCWRPGKPHEHTWQGNFIKAWQIV